MKNNKAVKIISGIVGLILLVVGIFLFKDLRQEKMVNNTIKNYVEDKTIPKEFKTTGEYRKIEDTTLDFLISLDQELGVFVKACEDIEEFDLYSPDHAYESLKDNFSNDRVKLKEYETTIIGQLDKLIELNTYDKLISKYESEDDYYNDFYKEVIGDKKDYDDAVETYKNIKVNMVKFFDVANRYVEFLDNSSLVIEEDKENMLFYTDEEVEQYNKLIDEIQSIDMDVATK